MRHDKHQHLVAQMTALRIVGSRQIMFLGNPWESLTVGSRARMKMCLNSKEKGLEPRVILARARTAASAEDKIASSGASPPVAERASAMRWTEKTGAMVPAGLDGVLFLLNKQKQQTKHIDDRQQCVETKTQFN